MHSAIVDATGYTLLLSSFIALVILLWKGCKRKRKSPFYVLSASDVFSTALTAIILLLNHIEADMELSYNWQNRTGNNMPNRAWTIEDNYRFPFLQAYDPHEAFNRADRNVTLTCHMKDILMQYGTLLAALTNAFISLLTFTVQCNFSAACMKKRCANVMDSLRGAQSEPKDTRVKSRENEIFESEKEPISVRDDINVRIRSNIIGRIMGILKFRALKEDEKRPTSFLVMCHWLIPFLVVGILYFAEYNDMNNVKNIEDIECIFESNFPMNDFDTFSDNLNVIDSTYVTLPEGDNFIDEKLSKPNSIEIDEVVSKVQSIVGTALSNSTKDGTANLLNTFQPQNFTDYILVNNIMRYVKNITSINGIVQGPNGTLTERDVNVYNLSTNNNIHLNQDSEIPLFDISKGEQLDATTSGNLSSVVSTENEDNSYQEDVNFASTEQNTVQTIADTTTFVQNATPISNDQIYGEILKRIQAASVHSAKNHYNYSTSRPKNGDQQSGISDLKNYIAKRKPNSIKDPFSNKSNNRYSNAETSQSSSLHMINECLISTKFLKLQLFILSFAVYFLSILLSCILQMRGQHMCKNTLATLRTKTDLPFTGGKETRQNSDGSSTSQGLRNDNSETDIVAIKKDYKSYRENESLALEIDCMVRIFNTIKLSLILCVVLWTPVFLGILLRVYSCTRAPQWLIDAASLSAFSFGIVRNALNINIMGIQEVCKDASSKENKIHPAE